MNNRLNITYSSKRIHINEESLRCNSKEAAERIVGNRNMENIKSAVFTDSTGKKTTIKEISSL